jgi:hypothetical protein
MTKTKTRLTEDEKNVILKRILEHAKTRGLKGYEYCYAYGYISAILTDEQFKNLSEGIK